MQADAGTTAAKLTPSPKNPRKVTKRQLAMLEKALKTFGDLGGIVFNRRTQRLVGGHQRSKMLAKDAPIVLHNYYSKPTEAGTVAEGYIALNGERLSYREVDWSPQTEALANIAANKAAGSFDSVMLADTLAGLSKSGRDLTLSMFDADELRAYLPDVQAIRDAAPLTRDQGEQPPAERVHGATKPGDAPHAEPPEEPSIKTVSLYFRPADHSKFVEIVDALKDVYHRTNTSDVVLEAIKRAAVKAAF